MTDPIIACVRTGSVYDFDYVIKMRNMVSRHMPMPYTMVCFTDMPARCEGVVFIDISETGLHGWWGKMLLFAPEWRGNSRVIYLDLDTVIIGSIAPLAAVPGEFAICENFTRLTTNPKYPCKYNSSVMVIGGGMAGFIWTGFDRQSVDLMARHQKHGDQAAIEELCPDAALLQHMVPKGFFFNYRHLTMHMPAAAVVNFGGVAKPHLCPIPWVQAEWV